MTRPPALFNKDNNPGGAKWCGLDGHKRLECTKDRKHGQGPCHAPAINGLNVCRIHAGHSKAVAVAKGQAVVTAWSALGKPADGQGIDSSAAVMGMLQQSWLRANLYGQLLQLQAAKDGTGEAGVDGAGNPGDTTGLIGYRYGAAGKDGMIYAVTEEARALVGLEAAERDRVVKYAKTAHDMGISDQLVALAERWGDVVAGRIATMLESLELTEAQTAMVPALLQLHLGSIDMTALDPAGT
jgi:hypothetical protein